MSQHPTVLGPSEGEGVETRSNWGAAMQKIVKPTAIFATALTMAAFVALAATPREELAARALNLRVSLQTWRNSLQQRPQGLQVRTSHFKFLPWSGAPKTWDEAAIGLRCNGPACGPTSTMNSAMFRVRATGTAAKT